MVVLIKILQVILALSILIIIHEAGHFFFAKLFRIRVEKFYLFFDVKFALFRFKPKNSDTDYGIGWLPLGGYGKISGMIDESMDMESMKKPPQPWEFRSKPAWQRLLVMAGGVLFNFIFAILLYIGIMAGWGESYISNEKNSIYVNDLAYEMGFRTGDRILMLDDYVPERFEMLQADMIRKTTGKATVLRGNDTLDIYIDRNMVGEMLNTPGMFGLAVPFVVDTVPDTSPNRNSGLTRGDRIISIEGQPTSYLQDSRELLKSYQGQTVTASVLRDKDTMEVALQVDTTGLLGIYTQIPGIENRKYSVLEAIPAGLRLTFSTIGGYIQDLKLVFTPSTEAYKSVGSFISMGQIFPASWDWYRFVNILALLSIMLGVMNLLPIPALDGGHIVFTIYEMVTGKLPFLAENSYGIMLKHISDTPVPPKKLNPKIPLGLEQIILCAMEKDVVNRYQSASQMIRHIYRIKKDPTTIFQKQTPAPRTPTAEVAIQRTTVLPDEPTTKQRKKTADQTTRTIYGNPRPMRKTRSPEYVPFSVVIVICIAFLVLAVIGFVILFNALANSKVSQMEEVLRFSEKPLFLLRYESYRITEILRP